ncbi:hypothetical protein CDV31_001752 [Fusarium ambrosium]|uniref:Uncharacterized protein n=1 Tax=Fusarium ambrosium TaxID=131363 RepID=A0A428UYK1_9HYPO|nr:hypothetical protein CDV31_001752 [Fusarium ambrosium]
MPPTATSLSENSLPMSTRLDASEINYFNLPFRHQTPPFVSVSFPTPNLDGSMKHQPSLPSMPENVFANHLPSTDTTPRPINHPRQSVSGFSGYWAERQVMMQRKSNSGKSFWKWRNRSTKSASESDARDLSFTSPLTSMSVPTNFKPFEQSLPRQPASPFVSESAHVFSLQHPSATRLSTQARQDRQSSSVSPGMGSSSSISPLSVAATVLKASTVPSSPSSTIGLYDKAKKSIESKLKFRGRKERCTCPPIPEYERPHSTTMDGAGNYHSVHQVTKSGTWFKDDLGKVKLRRKLFSKAPWSRKESSDSYSSMASSMRETLKGKSTPALPLLTCIFFHLPPDLGSDTRTNRKAVRVDCVDNQYPGGEAVRIKTPPLGEDTASGSPRSFFTELVPPFENDAVPFLPGPSARRNSLQTVRRRSITPKVREWWEQMPKKTDQDPFALVPTFEFQVPEHLPNSPICPANMGHQGGAGLCVYHGRRKGGRA